MRKILLVFVLASTLFLASCDFTLDETEDPIDIDVLSEFKQELSTLLPKLFDSNVSDEELLKMFDIVNTPDRTLFPSDSYDSFEIIDYEENDDSTATATVKSRFKAGAELSKKVNIAYGDLDNDGDLDWTFTFVESDEVDTAQDIMEIKNFFSDYFNPALSDELFFDQHQAGNNNEQMKNREIYLDSEYSIDIDGEGPIYRVYLLGRKKGYDAYQMRVDVRVNRWEESIVLDVNEPDDLCHEAECDLAVDDREENEMIFNWFLDMYFNPEISDDLINATFFDNMMEQDFFDVRKEMQAAGPRFQILEQVGPTYDDSFIYLLDTNEEGNRNGEPTKVKIIKRLDKASPLLLVLDPDDDGDGVPTADEVDFVLSKFIAMTNYQSIAYPIMCKQFTPEHRVDSCSEMLSSKTSNGYNLGILFRIKQRPDILTAEWDNAAGEKITEQYLFYPYYNDNREVVFELIPYIPTDIEALTTNFIPYIESLNNNNHSVDETCLLVDDTSKDECIEFKTFLLDTSSYTEVLEFVPTDETDKYVIIFAVYDRDGKMIGNVEYDVKASDDNPLYVDRGNRGVNPLFEE